MGKKSSESGKAERVRKENTDAWSKPKGKRVQKKKKKTVDKQVKLVEEIEYGDDKQKKKQEKTKHVQKGLANNEKKNKLSEIETAERGREKKKDAERQSII